MDVSYDFGKKVAVITGAATGLGREMALEFAKAGAYIAVCDFNEELGQKTADDIVALGSKAIFCKVDVRNIDDIVAMKKKVFDTFGGVDILISNAGVGPGKNKEGKPCIGPPLTNITYEDWQRIFDINLFGGVRLVTEFSDYLKEKRDGKIVFTSSISAYCPSALEPHYGASKIAVINFVQSLSTEFGPYNINVNAICPGFVYTPIYSNGGAMELKELRPQIFKDLNDGESVMNRMAMSMSAMKRPQTALDMANCVLFLCSDAAKEMTGQAICIDSGIVFR